jgi:hypothetical protein
VYKHRDRRYNKDNVKLVFEDGRTVWKLYRCGKLIYIGVHDDKMGHDERTRENGSSGHDPGRV